MGYIRVSTEDQTQGYSLDAQRTEIARYCERKGYELVRIYADEGVSAHTDKISKRPALSRLIDDAVQSQFDVVIVHTLDRWARNMRVQTEALQILGEAHVGFASVTENIDYTTPEGRLMLTMIGGFAEFFSAQLARHVKKGVRRRVEHGLPNGSVPFGYLSDHETGIACPVPEEAEAVQTAFAKRAAGETNGQIANWINAQGLTTRRGNPFTPESIRDMLTFRFYLGVVTLNNREFAGQHEAIIARDLFERVQTRTVKRGPGRARVGGPRGLLAGMIRCSRCGKPLQADRNKSGNPLYRERHASACETNRRSCVASDIDAQMGDLFCSLVLPRDWKQAIARQSVKTEGPSVADLEERRSRLGEVYADGTIKREVYRRRLEELDALLRMAQVSTTIELDEVAELLGGLPEFWDGAKADERRRLLQHLVEAVYVDIGSKRVSGIVPVPAFRTLVESGIGRIAGQPAILVDPDEVGVTGRMELVETGEAGSRRAAQASPARTPRSRRTRPSGRAHVARTRSGRHASAPTPQLLSRRDAAARIDIEPTVGRAKRR